MPDYFPFAGNCAKISTTPGSVRAKKCPGGTRIPRGAARRNGA